MEKYIQTSMCSSSMINSITLVLEKPPNACCFHLLWSDQQGHGLMVCQTKASNLGWIFANGFPRTLSPEKGNV